MKDTKVNLVCDLCGSTEYVVTDRVDVTIPGSNGHTIWHKPRNICFDCYTTLEQAAEQESNSCPAKNVKIIDLVISSTRAGYCSMALDRLVELSRRSNVKISYTKMYDDVHIDRLREQPSGIRNGNFHRFVLSSSWTLEQIKVILDPINFPEYNYYSEITITELPY